MVFFGNYRHLLSAYTLIVAQKAENTTCQIGEFLSQNLPNWQVFGVFKAMRNENVAEVEVEN
jgi:hypothetical protein